MQVPTHRVGARPENFAHLARELSLAVCTGCWTSVCEPWLAISSPGPFASGSFTLQFHHGGQPDLKFSPAPGIHPGEFEPWRHFGPEVLLNRCPVVAVEVVSRNARDAHEFTA